SNSKDHSGMQFSRKPSLVRQSSAVLLLLFLQVRSAFNQQTPALRSQPSTAGPTPAVAAPGHETTPGPALENLSSLSLAGSALHAEQPLVGEKDEYPDFTREFIQVQWRKRDPIDLYVIRPRDLKKPVEKPPVILYLYGYPSETQRFQDNGYCQRLSQDGFAAVGF